MAELPAGRFYVSVDEDRRAEARRLADQAASAGKRPDFMRWFREATFRLTHEADEWGESREQFPGGRVETRVGVVGNLVVWYSVDPGRGMVFVEEFRLRGDPAGE